MCAVLLTMLSWCRCRYTVGEGGHGGWGCRRRPGRTAERGGTGCWPLLLTPPRASHWHYSYLEEWTISRNSSWMTHFDSATCREVSQRILRPVYLSRDQSTEQLMPSIGSSPNLLPPIFPYHVPHTRCPYLAKQDGSVSACEQMAAHSFLKGCSNVLTAR